MNDVTPLRSPSGAGAGSGFEYDFGRHRAALTGHCYRMLGSVMDADDAVQETLIRALRAKGSFAGRSSLRTWLFSIATRVCLDTRSEAARRHSPLDDGPAGTPEDTLLTHDRSHWIEPAPEDAVLPADGAPEERAILRQSIRLAFVAALQLLPPRQRAALLLTEVLGWSAAEVAEALETTVAAVNSALQRARETLAARVSGDDEGEKPPLRLELGETERVLVDRYVDAFERYDLDALSGLLTREATLNMPPFSLWLEGKAVIRRWMEGPGSGCRGSKLVPVKANGMPAFAQYRDGGKTPWALLVLGVTAEGIASVTSFLDVETLFPRFGLPRSL